MQPLLRSSKTNKGILVSSVMEGSPAAKAGLKAGDILLSIDGAECNAQFKEQVPQFNQFVTNIPVGKTTQMKVLRNTTELNFAVTTVERQKALDKEYEIKSWGICATNITQTMQKEMQLPTKDGVMVSGILPSGPAGSAKPALNEGDIIVEIGPDAIKDINQLKTITQKLTDGKKDPVPTLIVFKRNEKEYMTVVKIGKEEMSEPGAEIAKAWLGIDSQVLTSELSKALGVAGKMGVRITQVFPNNNASKAGLKVGDLIIKLDGEEIPADQIGDEEVLSSLIRQYDIGAEVDLSVVRGGKASIVKVKLDAAPKPSRDYPRYEDTNLEFTARDITFSDKADGQVNQGQTGAYVESVANGSSSALGRLSAGDVRKSVV